MEKFTNINIIDEWLTTKGMEKEAYNLILNPPKENDWKLLNDIDKAVDILNTAITNNQKIRIWGDYDADGITGTSILLFALRGKVSSIDWEIPNREDGYGANLEMAKKAVNDNIDLIITVDNGIQCHEAIDFVKSNGITTLVTDHHEKGEILPNADAIVHPMLGDYPFPYISGATVALKLMLAFGISDVMPVGAYSFEEMQFNENRRLLIDAIERIRKHPYKNLSILMDISNVNQETFDEKDIGFTIAPIINSTGRLESADTGVLALSSLDEDVIKLNASYACYLNDTRKEITKKATTNIVDSNSESNVLVLNVQPGIVGIIAGNVLNRYGKPTIVFAKKQVEDKVVLVGSARSASVNLYEAFLNISPEIIISCGGHALAAGITILEENLEEFKEQFNNYIEQNKEEEVEESEAILTSFSELYDKKTLNTLKKLKPFGQGFQVPEFVLPVDIEKVDLYFKSGHVAVSDKHGNQLWLYNQIKDGQNMVVDGAFKKVMDNTEKRLNGNPKMGVAPMSYEEAVAGHWERWTGNIIPYYFLVEANYGTFQNNTGLQLSTITYEKR